MKSGIKGKETRHRANVIGVWHDADDDAAAHLSISPLLIHSTLSLTWSSFFLKIKEANQNQLELFHCT